MTRPQPHEIAELQDHVEALVEPARDLADREGWSPAQPWLREAVRELEKAAQSLNEAQKRRGQEADQ